MKKFVLSAIVLLLTLPSFGYAQNMTFDDGTTWNCDQNFAPVALRYQYQYRFFDTWNNLANVPAYMNEYQVRYKDSSYVRVGQTWPSGKTVDWTNQLVQNNYAVPAYSSMEVLSTFTNDWAVLNHPVVRTGNDFTIGYQIGYDFSNNYPDASDDIKHVECQPYYITWCGDGILDTNYETCDPAAPGQSPYTCDVATCQPIVQQPTCDKIRVYPKSGDVPLDVDVSCDVTNATSVAIDCGNGQTIVGKTGTCKYAAVGTFYPVCTVNTSITSNDCKTTVKVKNPAPYVSIKKYVKTLNAAGDTQTAPVSIARGEAFNYYYQLQNTGSVAATGVVVKDTLPSYLTYSGTITVKNPAGVDVSSDWTCVQGSQIFAPETISRITLVCSKKTDLPANSGLYTFTIPVVLATTAPVSVNMQNVVYACAANVVGNPTGPNGEIICDDVKPPPPPPPGQCDKTNPNSQKDPACIVVRPPVCTVNCGGGSTTYYIPTCINGIQSCAAQSHPNIATCQANGGGQTCYTDVNTCNAANTLSCGRGGSGFCGDGVLGSSPGEECDVIGAPWCVSCKIQLDTTPGANPITSMWIRIPALGGTSKGIGSSFIKKRLDADGTNADAYRIVVGKDTNVFTLADQVVFNVTTEFQIPIIVPANKKMCLQAAGASVNSPKGICTTFGDSSIATTPINGTYYVVLGAGSYQQRLPNGTYQRVDIQNPVHETSLFRGSTQYSQLGETNVGPTLRDAFKGVGSPADQGSINLFGCNGTDCSPSAVTQMITIPVRISNMLVSSIGSSSNRSLELVLNPANPFVLFLGTTSMNTSTTASNNTTNNVAVTLPTIVGTVANPTISSVTELERYAVNGNRNILSVTGDLTITCPAGSTVFTMNGIRTVIVTGNLIIRCNIVYGSSDSSSSWAWIAKNGNIQVSNGIGPLSTGAVTNLAGVYVAVKEPGFSPVAPNTTAGDITYIPTTNTTTQAILKVEGTLYGNASPLFGSRLYARATGAYDILTTGTILTYSNRALMSPPPLLSQYLGTYQVQRVVQ